MKISNFIICALLIGFVVVAFYSFADALAGEDAYNIELNQSYKDAFDKTNNISTQISGDYEKIIGKSDENETGWVVDKFAYLALIPQSVSLVKNMIKLPFTIVGEMMESFVEFFDLPDWMQSFFMTVILVLLIFGVIALILRYKDV